METKINQNIYSRIKNFASLKNGWDPDGNGMPYKTEDLKWIAEQVESNIESNLMRFGHISPHGDGSIGMEWDFKNGSNAIFEIDLEKKDGELDLYDKDDKYIKTCELKLDSKNGWEHVNREIKKIST